VSRVDLHPEELLDRARNGTASNEEVLRARAHIANCAACRIEQDLLIEIKQSAAAQPHDAIVAARIRAFVGHAVAARRTGAGQRPSARKWAMVAFAATLLLTTIGAAAVIMREHRRAIAPGATTDPAAVRPRPSLAAEAPSLAAPSNEEPKGEPEKTIEPPHDESPARALVRSPRTPAKAERPKAPDGSAAELFARANLLRRQDEVSEAVAVYRELQRSYPGSAEELLSRVVLGRLYLDRQGDAAAALAQFDSYSTTAPQGSLREEALVGRAVALGRLGRASDERKAWVALLEAFPRSTSAARARIRIAAIAP
jgi:TolA-binding protein